MTFHLFVKISSAVIFVLWNIIFLGFRAATVEQSPTKDLLDSLIAATVIFAFFTIAFFLGYFGIQLFVN